MAHAQFGPDLGGDAHARGRVRHNPGACRARPARLPVGPRGGGGGGGPVTAAAAPSWRGSGRVARPGERNPGRSEVRREEGRARPRVRPRGRQAGGRRERARR